jgi:hypothetical protein
MSEVKQRLQKLVIGWVIKNLPLYKRARNSKFIGRYVKPLVILLNAGLYHSVAIHTVGQRKYFRTAMEGSL